ncbi:AraC family transcriptional regulator [Ideonella sp. DXS29W]|uniref:AraC family transcriptional regulator n=1 Tax=Ideonella lacteola TaxID=2984193 RepID=A0ABU9BXC8_9BURK
METAETLTSARCPDPLTRAPRWGGDDSPTRGRLLLPPAALQGAIVAMIGRDTAAEGIQLSDAQRMTHFPASVLLSLSWYQGLRSGRIHGAGDAAQWQPFGSDMVVTGSQSEPSSFWTPDHGRGCLICFTADVAQHLFGIDPATVIDRHLPADEVMDSSWRPMFDELLATRSDAESMAVVRRHVAPRWQAVLGRSGSTPSLRQVGRQWVNRLAWQANEWRRGQSPRQVERRIKSYSGRSLRDWETLVRTEGLFFSARSRHEAGEPFDWAALAQDEGFSDQSHLIRICRRICGFTPSEFAHRFVHDESFWVYRLWV